MFIESSSSSTLILLKVDKKKVDKLLATTEFNLFAVMASSAEIFEAKKIFCAIFGCQAICRCGSGNINTSKKRANEIYE